MVAVIRGGPLGRGGELFLFETGISG